MQKEASCTIKCALLAKQH